MKKMKITVLVLAMVVCGYSVMAEGLYTPNTDGDDLGRTDKRFGVVHADSFSNLTAEVYATNVVTYAADIETGTIESAALTDKAAILSTVTMSVVTNTGDTSGTNVVTYTALDIAGNAVTAPFVFRTWITDDEEGALAAVTGSFTVDNGMELEEVLDKADYWISTTNDNVTATVTIVDLSGGTNYIHCLSPTGFRTTVPSAFDTP